MNTAAPLPMVSNREHRFGLSQAMWDAVLEIRPPEETPFLTTEAKRASSVYMREDRYQAEIEHIFRSYAVPVMMSSRIPDPGTSLAHDGYGVPLLFTRDREGKLRAFINGCRHRGSKLVEGCDPVKGGRITCPYHTWSYGLDGQLLAISRPELFPSLDKADLPLIELTCFEDGGLVFVGLDPRKQTKIIPNSDEILADLNAPAFNRRHIYGFQTFDLQANWKLVTEAFLEGYHAPRLHAKSVGAMFTDATSVFRFYGPHTMQISGRKVFDASVLDQDVNIHRYVTSSHILFPNLSVITSPYYTSYMIFMPRGRDRTWVEYYMMTDGPPESEKAADLFARSYELILEVFGKEDFHASSSAQAALETGLIPEVYFGGLEMLVGPFHDSIEALLPPSAV